ncbi:MAG: hydroxyacid dehydrogenase [Burkholderiaceae bacterium]|nr:hydroxyacid dehydrogenase [Burkholderiaceae bacterium]
MSTEKPRVLLTSAIDPAMMPLLMRHAEVIEAPDPMPATIARLIRNVDGLIVRNTLAADVFEHAKRIRAVVRHGVGLDMIPVEAATARGIAVANLPGSNTTAVVEYVLAAMFLLRRRIGAIDASLREQGWASARPLGERGSELSGATCGIVGVGAIGSRLSAAARALGMQVLGLTRRPETLPLDVQAADKETLFSRSDVVVLCCPLNEQTRGLVDSAALAKMKPDALLINVSRGPVVDTAALVAALRAGRLGGAALDVHDRQPLAGDELVFDCPNLLLTPHVAGTTATSMRAMSRGAVETLLALLRGERPANVVNAEVFERPGATDQNRG